MPCYNAGASVARAVASIQAQTYEHWELIVVDDGSSDRSADIVADIAARDSRVRLVRSIHQGVVAASNKGFELTNSPLIARMDADDVSMPDRLTRQVLHLEQNPDHSAVSCLTRFAGNPDSAGGYAHHVSWTNRHKDSEHIALNRFIDLPVPHPTLMYRRELVEEYGGYRHGNFPEDYEMILRWIAAGAVIGKVDALLYDWHDPPSRLSRTDNRYHMDAFHLCKAPYLAQAIRDSGNNQRELWIWGAGRPARKCAQPLEKAWKPATGFIDIDPRKIGRSIHGRPVVSPDDLPPAHQSVIVSYVATRGAGDQIRSKLLEYGRKEGSDFWICA